MHLNVEGMESERFHESYSSNLPKRKDLKEIKKKLIFFLQNLKNVFRMCFTNFGYVLKNLLVMIFDIVNKQSKGCVDGMMAIKSCLTLHIF